MRDGEPGYSAGLGIGTAVAGSGDDKARTMDEQKTIKQTVAGSVLALIAAGWLLGTPYLVFGAIITSAPFFGETASPEEMQQATMLLVGALLCGLALPVVGTVVAALAGFYRAVWLFVVALIVSLVGLALLTF